MFIQNSYQEMSFVQTTHNHTSITALQTKIFFSFVPFFLYFGVDYHLGKQQLTAKWRLHLRF